ncbi:MAG: molybdopterin molybdenumtransferase MoeA, partial [Acidobacteria bacterium]|nr:molybdopterin molybdenumtransferase MoeA [Acidobacteriota bacterium]
MISISEALEIIEKQTGKLSIEKVNLAESIGRVINEEIRADMDLPPFNRSQIDGFAVRLKDLEMASGENPVKLKIIGESVAGKGFNCKIKKGETVRIMTGARVPDGADTVQKKELTREFQSANGENFVEILEAAKLQQNIVKQAGEIKRGEKVFENGDVVNEKMIASLASFGYAKVAVARK